MGEKTPKWLREQANQILIGLGYDLTQDVNKQFEERHKEILSQPSKKQKRNRQKKKK